MKKTISNIDIKLGEIYLSMMVKTLVPSSKISYKVLNMRRSISNIITQASLRR